MKKKPCKCLSEFEKLLKTATGDPETEIDWVSDISGFTWPRLHATYRKKNRGLFSKKRFEHTIIPTFCPFCGKKYK